MSNTTNFRNKALLLFTMISGFSLLGKAQNDTLTLRYYRVINQVFSEEVQNYVSKDTVQTFGKIKIDKSDITVMDYEGNVLKKFTVTSKEKSSDRDLYNCTLNNEKYGLFLTEDRTFFTQLGYNDRFIYFLMPKDAQFMVLKPEKPIENEEESIYIASTIQEPPLFGEAANSAESDKALDQYIKSELAKMKCKEKGKVYYTVTLDTSGKVEKVKLLMGKNEKLNKATQEILEKLPEWKAGMHQQKAVKCNVTVAITAD